MSRAEKIVEAVLADLGDRSGVGNALDGIDDDIKVEMKEELVEKVQALLDGKTE